MISIKKALLLTILITITALFHAFAAPCSVFLFDAATGQWAKGIRQQIAAADGTLYIARPEGLYAYGIGDEEPEQLMNFSKTNLAGEALAETGNGTPVIEALMTEDGILYALDTYSGALWRFDEGKSTFIQEASFNPQDVYGTNDQNILSGFLLEDGDVYYIARSTVTPDISLMCLNIKSGKVGLVRSGIQAAVPYAPGVLLVGTDNMGRLESLALLDVKAGRMEEKLKLDANYTGLNYDPATDIIYLLREGEIHAIQGSAPPVPVTRMPIISPESDGALLNGGYIALPYEDGVRIYSTNPSDLKAQPLKISGQTSELPMEAFSAVNPDITFSFIDAYPETTMDLVMHMSSGDSSADIYAIYLRTYSIDDLYEKGYFADLGGGEEIKSTISSMYPFLKDVLVRDGQILALPFWSYYSIYGYNPRAFEEVGLTEADVPDTYGELLDFMVKWEAEYAEKYPSMSLFGQDADIRACKLTLINSILDDQMYACLRRGESVAYDTPEMLELMDKFAKTDFSSIRAFTPDISSEENVITYDWPKQLFQIGGYAGTQTANSRQFSYMPLKISENEQPVVLADVQALLINPYTQNFDTALKFVTFAAGNLPKTLRADLMPGENEPIRDTSFDFSKLEDDIELTEKALKEAKEEDKRAIQDRLDRLNKQYTFEKSFEWISTKESIAAFRALDPLFVLQIPNPAYGIGANAELQDLIYKRFLDGQLTAGQFIKELDRKLHMMELENRE